MRRAWPDQRNHSNSQRGDRSARRRRTQAWQPPRAVACRVRWTARPPAASGSGRSSHQRTAPAAPQGGQQRQQQPAADARASPTLRHRLAMGADDNGRMTCHPTLPLHAPAGRAAPDRLGPDPRPGPRRPQLPARPADAGRAAPAPGTARLAGYCSAKGRLLATSSSGRGADDLLLACSADLLPPTLKRCRCSCCAPSASSATPAPTCRCGAWPAPHQLPGWATAPAAAWASASLGDGGDCVRLPPARVDGTPRWLLGRLTPRTGAARAAGRAWAALEVLSGVPRIVAATVEQFVPQMVNLELVGGVNFQKGCYPGPGDRGAQPVPRHAEAPRRLTTSAPCCSASVPQPKPATATPSPPASRPTAPTTTTSTATTPGAPASPTC
jgi:hypothetical protein